MIRIGTATNATASAALISRQSNGHFGKKIVQ